MNIIKWAISFVSHNSVLSVGSRVMTPMGMGTVTHSALSVDLDNKGKFDRLNQTFLIENVKVKG